MSMGEQSLKSGICRVCGCTEDRACLFDAGDDSGEEITACWWVDAAHTLCSNPNCLAVVPLEQIDAALMTTNSVLEAEGA